MNAFEKRHLSATVVSIFAMLIGSVAMLDAQNPTTTRQAIEGIVGRTDQRGMFKLGGIAPGTYRVYALANPEQLEQPADRGALIDIEPASTMALDLRFNPR